MAIAVGIGPVSGHLDRDNEERERINKGGDKRAVMPARLPPPGRGDVQRPLIREDRTVLATPAFRLYDLAMSRATRVLAWAVIGVFAAATAALVAGIAAISRLR